MHICIRRNIGPHMTAGFCYLDISFCKKGFHDGLDIAEYCEVTTDSR